MAKEKTKFNLKDQLAGIAALIAAIVAIGEALLSMVRYKLNLMYCLNKLDLILHL